MPLPSPKGKEKKNDFISRCVDDETMKKEFPDNRQQRLAVCYAQWGKAKKKNEETELKEFKAEAGPNDWIISYQGKKATPNDLPPQQKKIFDQMVKNLKRDGLFRQMSKKKDTKNPDMVLKSDAVNVYDENGKLLKSYKL